MLLMVILGDVLIAHGSGHVLGFVPLWNAYPETSSRVAALAVDVIVPRAVLVPRWPADDVVPG